MSSIPRRVRFEVLRRDDHTCRYCGRSAPDVSLEVDHVIPLALGGLTVPENLVTACADCNGGKASSTPSEKVVAQVSADAIRWATALEVAADQRWEEREARTVALAPFDARWTHWGTGPVDNRVLVPRPSGWETTVARFLDLGVEMYELTDLVDTAMHSRATPANTWKYFCGCAWNVVHDLQHRAKAFLIGDPACASDDDDDELEDHVLELLVTRHDIGYQTGYEHGLQVGEARARDAGSHDEPLSLQSILRAAN